MSSAIYKGEPHSPFKVTPSLLSCIWMMGLLFGMVISFRCRDFLISQIPVIYPALISKHLKILFVIVPFLFSALAVHFSHPNWLVLICAVKAAQFAISCFVLCLCYGQAGWLARWMFIFSDVCSLPVLFLYCLRNLGTSGNKRRYEFIFFFSLLTVLLIVDHKIVTPFASQFGIY